MRPGVRRLQLGDVEPARFRAYTAVPYFMGWHIHIHRLVEQMGTEVAAAQNDGHRDEIIRKWIAAFDGMARLGLEQRRALARKALGQS